MEQKTKYILICLAVVAVIIFIGSMLGTSLRKLTTEEGKFIFYSCTEYRWKIVLFLVV